MTDTQYELSVTRLIDAPPATVWRVFTERLEEWWCPKPWTTELIEQDLRLGGRLAMVMRGPNGEEQPIESVVLEAIPERSLIFTDAYKVGWVTQTPFITGFFTFEEEGGKTRYTASARHWNAEAMKRHEEMGFHDGWGKVAEQLAELAEAETD